MPRYVTFVCPRCGGDGSLIEWSEGQIGGDFETYTCPDCEGRGEQERVATVVDSQRAQIAERCPTCRALPGEACHPIKGGPRYARGYFHAARKSAARVRTAPKDAGATARAEDRDA